MQDFVIAVFRFFALVFLLPGLAGLVADATLSTHHFDTQPRNLVPAEQRTVGRTLNGQVVYLTMEENEQPDSLRYYGLRAFGIGAGLGLLYLGAMASHLDRYQDSGAEDTDD